MSNQPSSSADPSWYGRIFGFIGFSWHRLVCTLFNLRRRLFLRHLTAYPIIQLEGDLLERAPDGSWASVRS